MFERADRFVPFENKSGFTEPVSMVRSPDSADTFGDEPRAFIYGNTSAAIFIRYPLFHMSIRNNCVEGRFRQRLLIFRKSLTPPIEKYPQNKSRALRAPRERVRLIDRLDRRRGNAVRPRQTRSRPPRFSFLNPIHQDGRRLERARVEALEQKRTSVIT